MFEKIKTKLNGIVVEHPTLMKGALAVGTVATYIEGAKADITSDAANGTTLLQAGIAVAQTPPLGYIVDTFAVAIGAVMFVKIVRRFL